ncbi:MAG: hypothetical protein HYX78_04460 [Armatimonadetes bacterium]|nr:hypothetical protein [Armatimonadota bacterium]
MGTSAVKIDIEDTMRTAARVYLEDRIYDTLVGREEPAKTGEILRDMGMEDLTLRVVRHILITSARFESTERRWTLATRFEDTQRPFERVVENIIESHGRPMVFSALAQELAYVYRRPVRYYEEIAPRLLSSQDKFFSAGGDTYGLSKWLVIAESDEPEDVLFDNFMEESDIESYRKGAGSVEWSADDIAGSAEKALSAAGGAVPLKALGYLAWESMRDEYDPVEFYSTIAGSKKIEILSNQQAVSSKHKKELMKTLQDIATEIEEMPIEVEEQAEAGPVTVTEADRDEIVDLVLKSGGTLNAEEILESVIEISSGEPGYDEALESLKQALEGEERVIRVGPDRWRPAGSIPEEILEAPAALAIPLHTPFETPEGDVYDQELEDEGLESGLRQEILNPLVQDVGDEDPEETQYQPLDQYQRAVLKYHHKLAGTMPLIQFHPDFFGTEPEIIHITLIDGGMRRDVWVNNKTRLMYGMKDWYTDDMPISGAAFEIHKTGRSGEYRFVYDNRTDALIFVPTSRLLELLDLKDEAESRDAPLFDIITRILEHYRKGIGFVSLFTEVNLVRRATRRLVASILSSYHCFHTRGKTGEWQYDAKKRSQGFNKSKRKYVKK